MAKGLLLTYGGGAAYIGSRLLSDGQHSEDEIGFCIRVGEMKLFEGSRNRLGLENR